MSCNLKQWYYLFPLQINLTRHIPFSVSSWSSSSFSQSLSILVSPLEKKFPVEYLDQCRKWHDQFQSQSYKGVLIFISASAISALFFQYYTHGKKGYRNSTPGVLLLEGYQITDNQIAPLGVLFRHPFFFWVYDMCLLIWYNVNPIQYPSHGNIGNVGISAITNTGVSAKMSYRHIFTKLPAYPSYQNATLPSIS